MVVTVTDVNDELPQWLMSVYPYKEVVPTDAPSGASIYQLRAEDTDAGSEVKYYLRSGKISEEEKNWKIEQTTTTLNTYLVPHKKKGPPPKKNPTTPHTKQTTP